MRIRSTYQLMGIISIAIFVSCRKQGDKDAKPSSPKEYTVKMSGKHVLKGTVNYSCFACSPPYTRSEPGEYDAIFNVLNDSTIFAVGFFNGSKVYDTLRYDKHDTAENNISFYGDVSYFGYDRFEYYYLTGRMVYDHFSHTSGSRYDWTLSSQ